MIAILNIGMNHETAPVEMRECLAGDPQGVARALSFMRTEASIREGLFLSTCNRVEALVTTEQADEATKGLIAMMHRIAGIPEPQLSKALYRYQGMDAVRHIFRVASSLDSMVVGEPQILGQVKEAYGEASRSRSSGVILNRLMHRSFHVAKRVRTETGICEAAVSIAYAAVELAKKIFHELAGKKVLLIGAGEMAELALRHLLRQGITEMAVANRTFERAVELARNFGASAVSFDEMDAELSSADIVITSTGATEPFITPERLRGIMRRRRNRALFFIDIAVPRNVQPEVNLLDNVYVYDIDDLQGVIRYNLTQRQQEALKAERIVEEEVVKFEKWLKTLSVVPTIISVREKAARIVQAELKKSGPTLVGLNAQQQSAIQTLALSIAEKVVNDPILFLKSRADRPSVHDYIDSVRKLFRLDDEENGTEDTARGGGKAHGSRRDDRKDSSAP
jgi:glutamyl-tRNA reductase